MRVGFSETTSHTAANGKETTLQAALGGDVDARYWGSIVVERDGSTVKMRLQDGTIFVHP